MPRVNYPYHKPGATPVLIVYGHDRNKLEQAGRCCGAFQEATAGYNPEFAHKMGELKKELLELSTLEQLDLSQPF